MDRKGLDLRIGAATLGLLCLASSGCAAGRSTYFMAKSMEPLTTTEASDAPDLAIYAWTMADQYRKKAWDEWCSSDFEEAERLTKLSVEWANKAQKIAASGGAVQLLDEKPTMDQVRAALKVLQGQTPAPAAPPAEEEGLQ